MATDERAPHPLLRPDGLSTADADQDDPTIRREVGFAKTLGANCLVKVNITPYRATDPRALVGAALDDAEVLRLNREALLSASLLARNGNGRGVFAAWGAVPKWLDRWVLDARRHLGAPLLCLGLTKSGHPRHPLYLPANSCPMEWDP